MLVAAAVLRWTSPSRRGGSTPYTAARSLTTGVYRDYCRIHKEEAVKEATRRGWQIALEAHQKIVRKGPTLPPPLPGCKLIGPVTPPLPPLSRWLASKGLSRSHQLVEAKVHGVVTRKAVGVPASISAGGRFLAAPEIAWLLIAARSRLAPLPFA